MKFKPVSQNPLCRWSKGLRWPKALAYPGLHLGMEGCGTALNATNCIRACLYFGGQPPTFLNAKSFADIASLERHEEPQLATTTAVSAPAAASVAASEAADPDSLARFAAMYDPDLPTVVLENFVDGARPIEGFDFPEACNIVAGHENRGVSQFWIDRADHVVFIPQYGTISSMNVVSSSGIALFHYHLAQQRRRRRGEAKEGELVLEARPIPALESYFDAFRKALPKDADGERLDKRPVHPSLYRLEHEAIQSAHRRHRSLVLGGGGPSEPFHLAVLYENRVDTRNLGGLVRNANSYLCPVFYVGKRRINKQGTVGSDHYTELVHLPTAAAAAADNNNDDDTAISSSSSSSRALHTHHLPNPAADYEHAVRELITRRRMEVWELSLDQEPLWAAKAPADPSVPRHLAQKLAEPRPVMVLDSPDATLLAELAAAKQRAPGGVALLVPQEGLEPSAGLRAACSRRVRLVGAGSDGLVAGHRGLPSQVGASIALHRLFSTLLHLPRE